MSESSPRGRLDTPRTSRSFAPRVDVEAVGRVGESFARFLGTGRYLAIQTVFVIVWILLNLFAVSLRWDPYPFILLNLAFSTQAAYAAPLILLAQNRQENRDRVSLEEDRRRAEQTKADTEYLARELAALRLAVGEVVTRDYLRRELEELQELLEALQPDKPEKSEKAKPRKSDAERRAPKAGYCRFRKPTCGTGFVKAVTIVATAVTGLCMVTWFTGSSGHALSIEDGRVRIGAALSSARSRVSQAARSPVIGMAVITPLVLAAAVGASGPTLNAHTPAGAKHRRDADGRSRPDAHRQLRTHGGRGGPTAVELPHRRGSEFGPAARRGGQCTRRPSHSRDRARAYRNAESMMSRAYPGCGISWNLLAGIGRIESGHANGGATDARGNPVKPIYGPALDGTLPGNEIIVQTAQAGRVSYARAMGPMQFLPGTWSRYASDGDGDGKADPQNVYDATLGRGPLPVQRRPQSARLGAGHHRDPAVQQLDGVCPQRDGLGGVICHRRRAGRPAADHRIGAGARRFPAGRRPPGQP